MSDKYINLTTGLAAIRDWVVALLDDKQDELVSGANIKTINSESLLGSGDVSVMATVPNATQYNVPQFDSNGQVTDSGVSLNDRAALRPTINSSTDFSVYAEQYVGTADYKGMGFYTTTGDYVTLQANNGSGSQGAITVPSKNYVDDEIAGLANPNQSVTINANGQLEVGGRLGQFPTTTGIYAPNNRDPRAVGDYSMLVTDALGMNLSANRSMSVVSGYGLACKSAAAGATEYRVTNNYANRILCKLAEGGFASRDEATSKVEQIVQVVSVTINGASYTPNSAANDSSNDIVIKTSETLNPDSAITNIRLFGTMGAYATIHTGNGIKSESGGRNLLLGGGVTKAGSGNDNCMVGNGMYSSGNGNALFGRYHIARKNRGLLAGTGHDSTNAPSEGASAVGQYSYMDAYTLFAVGNGTSHTDRKNAFEVRTDGAVLRSPNGTRYLVSVSDTGELTATAIT